MKGAMGKAIADEPAAQEHDSGAQRSGDAASASGSTLLGTELARARRQAGLTQRELADRLGVRLWMVEQWEAGAKPIPQETGGLIAAAIGAPAVERMPALLASADAMGDDSSRPLTAPEIREAVLPRSLRGYDEAATRRLLSDVAIAYERSVSQCDELRERAEQLAQLSSTDMDAVVAERDQLRTHIDELAAELAERERAATPPDEQDELRRRVEELEQALAGYEESEQALSRALVAASRAGEELRKEAEAEAQAIIDDARRSADGVQREIDDRRDSFENERAAIMAELKREALAAARDDLRALEHAAKPILDALAVFEERLCAIAPPEAEETAEAEMLEDLKTPPAEKAATGEADRD